jgi:hypothetical protein
MMTPSIRKRYVFALASAVALLLSVSGMWATIAFAAEGDDNAAGDDSPDGLDWWFGAADIHHLLTWHDYNGSADDYTVDQYLKWSDDGSWFDDPCCEDFNLVHEANTDDGIYEATSWFHTDMEFPDHNEDSAWAEEQYDEREEREIGWEYPYNSIIPDADHVVQFTWEPLEDNEIWFWTESELTDESPFP